MLEIVPDKQMEEAMEEATPYTLLKLGLLTKLEQHNKTDRHI